MQIGTCGKQNDRFLAIALDDKVHVGNILQDDPAAKPRGVRATNDNSSTSTKLSALLRESHRRRVVREPSTEAEEIAVGEDRGVKIVYVVQIEHVNDKLRILLTETLCEGEQTRRRRCFRWSEPR